MAAERQERTAETSEAKILLVDDRPENLLALETLLGPLGHTLIRASSGREALRHLLHHEFAVILLDVQMAGMDGFETAALIRERERSKKTPIIFLTAVNRTDEFIFKGYSYGAVDYLLKPFPPEILRTKVSVFVDLFEKTEQVKRQERRLRERAEVLERQAAELSRSNAELEQFAYLASHDMREPLRKIASFAQILAQRYKGRLDKEADEYIEYIVDGVSRMNELITGLLQYSRAGADRPAPRPVDVDDVVEKALGNLAVAVKESGATVLRGTLPTIYADPLQLTQLFQNLIGNALKFRGEEKPLIKVSAEKSEGHWVFTVEDNGIGIEPRHHERIFSIFKRLHGRDRYPGTGIGLAICRKVVEQHAGRIWVESEPGKGAAFRFALPSGPSDARLEDA